MNKVKSPVRRAVTSKPSASEENKSDFVPSAVNETFALSSFNYKMIGVGIAVLIIGYFLLSMEKFVDATQFSIALYVAPFIIAAGYGQIIYAIMARPKNKSVNQVSE